MIKQIIYTLFITLLISSCTNSKRYIKLTNKEIVELIKQDALNNKVCKILSPKGEVIDYKQAVSYSPSKYYVDRYLDTKNDSIILRFRKIKNTDITFNKTLQLYHTYGTYADTINAKMNIDCNQLDRLLSEASLKDKENRLSGTIDPKVDALNQRLLFNIFNSCDFHSSIKNKQESSHNALTILLHANSEYQKKYLLQIKKAVKLGYLEPKHLAYLYDKIAVGDNQPQKYGTQSTIDKDGNTILLPPYDNLDKVNKRRTKLGLPPITK
ncbi:hypothetical protein HX017_17195 [Myroides marinus]|uniref:DUF6624 domain-containing protein n=1 Tax=Myroides marinus TaxID=703342 RepID=UPI0007420046|nr:DUF6624 domain-containing protein [Myroides marinus]KUF38203.1 hypothetical protein AS361_08115 [Myroides marinus]MDM1348685.1 hypothetical protein [Myroides marinus]MDM1352507.1 hypothetical protein [Myroides marinus]MDM1355853.1 hypothetical protein [Myroides marinus]MDM1359712.1 hypothetical protein [Myroides marinus]